MSKSVWLSGGDAVQLVISGKMGLIKAKHIS